MSRTYRRDRINLDINDKPFSYGMSWYDYAELYDFYRHRHYRYDYYSKRNSKIDNKPWGKSPGWYKKERSRIRRARIREAMAHERYDNIPRFRKDNDWNWT